MPSVKGTLTAKKHGVSRSTHWPTVEKHYLKKSPTCAASGVSTGCQVHHIAPFHFCILLGRPDLELDERNFITLSETVKGCKQVNYHLLIGHADDFQSSNIHVKVDALFYFGKDDTHIKSDTVWRDRVRSRLKPWNKWTEEDKMSFRSTLDSWYPLPTGITPEQQLEAIIESIRNS